MAAKFRRNTAEELKLEPIVLPPAEAVCVVETTLEHMLAQSRRSLGLTNAEEAAYLIALNLVTVKALELLRGKRHPTATWAAGRSAEQILAGSACRMSTDGSDNNRRLSDHRRSVCETLASGLGNADPALDAALQAAGWALYCLLLRKAGRDIERRRLMRESLILHRRYIDEMRHSIVAPGWRDAMRPARFEVVLRRAVAFKSAGTQTPRLILVHDVDRNLTVSEDHYAEFPLFDLWSRIHELHRNIDLGPAEARFAVLSIFGASHRSVQDAWHAQLRWMGNSLAGAILRDALELFVAEAERGRSSIESCFVTGNHTIVAAQMAESLGLPGARIWGVDEASVDGFDKPLAVLEILRDNPCAIVVVSDDGDTELVRAVRESSAFENGETAGFAHLALFVARESNGQEAYAYALGPELAKAGFPFLSNVLQTRDKDQAVGYQGMNRIVELYQSLVRG